MAHSYGGCLAKQKKGVETYKQRDLLKKRGFLIYSWAMCN